MRTTNGTLRTGDRKRVMRAAIAALLAGASGLAAAQSSVTLYGRVGGGIDYTNKIATPNGTAGNLQYGGNQWGTSIWGLKGSEDLGGGLSAVMNLEKRQQNRPPPQTARPRLCCYGPSTAS